jgi:hypothetical protein
LGTFGRPHGPFQGGDQGRTLGAQLGFVPHGQFAKYFFAFRSKLQQDLTTVFPSAASSHQASGGKPVYQFDSAVVLELQSLGQRSDSRVQPCRQSFKGQHQLVLLRFQPHFPRRLFAEVKKPANLMAQFGQRLVVGKDERVFQGHSFYYIVTRYIIGRTLRDLKGRSE